MSEEPNFHSEQDSFIQNLRKQTAASHQKLEENDLSKMILNEQVSLVDYQNYLSALYGVTLGCENFVFPRIADIIPDLDQRYRSQLVTQDLLATGFTKNQIEALPVYRFAFSSVAGYLGAMYVLEGSTLGGRILYKHINKTLGLTLENGGSYFWGYGEQTGLMWKSFISPFAQYALGTGKSAEIIQGAVNTFTIIDKWLDEAVIEK
ncbi:biliverdin-producing heme oxygenase [Dyadobacter sp. LJ53]|uniref:biliverdin-producing heme oxygenase n=1 Tax=Dyadobacter chenwenxiniae TaxID=2906456 RepID=UPI001F43BE0C|nr:biliverdin-producing heme oxygenase [Dyadobacter chenwenxiniae]MCF0053698.1 biliverdin-producing heme oxygenase [Dyadobacter chenwenxiniae]